MGQSLTNGNSLGFQFFTTSSVVAINNFIHTCLCSGDFICIGQISKFRILDSKAFCIFNLIDVAMAPQNGHNNLHFQHNVWECPFLTSQPTLNVIFLIF